MKMEENKNRALSFLNKKVEFSHKTNVLEENVNMPWAKRAARPILIEIFRN